jgi:hypothetical protein
MRIRRLWLIGIAALPFASLALAAFPIAAQAQTSAEAPAVPGWDQLVESLRTLPERMLAKLPETMRGDPQVQQEIARLALESLTTSALGAIGGDGDAPQFLPSIGMVLNVGQPNADTIYRTAELAPGGSYRLTGKRGTLPLAVIAQLVPGEGGGAMRPHLDLATLKVDADDRFDVLISAVRPAGYAGEWWELNPAATRLMMRMVSADWASEASPTISIERTDRAVARPRPAAAALEARLRALPQQVDMMALMFLGHVEQLRAEGFVNTLKVFNVPFGALAGQFYYEGAYDLADDEALVIDSPVPAKCQYRSLILTNEIYETTDWINNHSSLNGAQAAPDSDGRLRIVISARDPGVRNWMDTAGYPRGAVQGRWTGCDSQPIPEVHKVKLADLRKLLPKDVAMVTPAERQEILRQRRRALLQRPYW